MGVERFEVQSLTLFSIDQKVFPNWPKNRRMHHMITFIWEFLLRFSRKDVGRIFWWIIKLNWIENNECFKWRRPSENFYKYFLGRTLAGKKCITCLHPSKIILHYLKDVRRMSQNIIGTIPRGGFGAPPRCRPPFFLVVKKSEVTSKSSFKFAENRAASSL